MPDLILSGNVYVLDPNFVAEIVQTNGQYPLSIIGYVTPSSAPSTPVYQIPPQLPVSNYAYPSLIGVPASPSPVGVPSYPPSASLYSDSIYAIPPGSIV